MKCSRPAWPLLLFVLAHCSSPARVCPAPQLFVEGVCVDLCEDFNCDDSNECTFEECEVNEQELTASCIRTDVSNGTDCDTADGSPGVCMTGQCELGTGGAGGVPCDPVDCDDGNDCTLDGTCNAANGQCEGGQNAQEGAVCNGTGLCDGAGQCLECSLPQHCNDDNECTQDTCSEGTCEHENIVGRACDYMGGSQNGVCDDQSGCGAPPPNCVPNPCADTGNDCTLRLCNPADGSCSVVNLDGACNDAPGGNPGTCDGGVCVGLCEEACPDAPDCLMDATCDPQDGVCTDGDPEPSNTACSEDGGQRCNGQGECVECTSETHCDDDNECTADSCSIGTGECSNQPRNGASCTSVDGLPGRCLGTTCDPGPPVVKAIHPPDGTSGISPCLNMVAVFDRPMDPLTVNVTTVLLNQSSTFIELEIFYNANNNSVIFAPRQCLDPSTLYTISIRGVKDNEGREMTIAFISLFATNAFDCIGQICGIN